jgi:hypothetical protein
VKPEEFMKVACPTVGSLGWAFYFVPETKARAEEAGLNVYQLYFLGRGGVLGDVEAPVVQSAFGYFNFELLKALWDSGRAVMAPRDAGRLYMECCHQFGRRHFADVDDLAEFCAAAGAVNDAAGVVGLPLYAGIKSEPLAEDLPARAMQLVTVLREFRGSAHLLAVVAEGVDPVVAHFLRRPDDMAMFGWGPENHPTVTDAERAALAKADARTDRLVLPAYSVLDDAGRQAFLRGLERMEAALALGAGLT